MKTFGIKQSYYFGLTESDVFTLVNPVELGTIVEVDIYTAKEQASIILGIPRVLLTADWQYKRRSNHGKAKDRLHTLCCYRCF